jgi:hypothetical protein
MFLNNTLLLVLEPEDLDHLCEPGRR